MDDDDGEEIKICPPSGTLDLWVIFLFMAWSYFTWYEIKVSVIQLFLLIPFTCYRFRCSEAPFLASKPHFLDTDEKLLRDVDGLNPNRNEHDIFLELEMVKIALCSLFCQGNMRHTCHNRSILNAQRRMPWNLKQTWILLLFSKIRFGESIMNFVRFPKIRQNKSMMEKYFHMLT